MTDVASNHLIAWCIYMLAVVGAMVIVRRLCNYFRLNELASVIRIIVLVVLVIPAQIDPEMGYWAPAFMAAFMDLIAIGPEAAFERIIPVFIILVASIALSFFWRKFLRKKAAPPA